MNKKSLPVILGIGLVILFLVGCGATGSIGEVTTPSGTYAITKVDVSDTFPPGCDSSTGMCQQAKPGHKIMVVWLDPKEELDAISGGLDLQKEANSASIIASDGSKTKGAGGGLLTGKWFILFTPPDSAKDFTLNWFDNPPIELGK
jgi:hypothetical protein